MKNIKTGYTHWKRLKLGMTPSGKGRKKETLSSLEEGGDVDTFGLQSNERRRTRLGNFN